MGAFREGTRFSLVTIGIIAAGIAFIMLVGSMWIFGFGWFQRSTADFRGKTAQIEKTRANANYRIANYDHFFDLCSAIQADEGRLAAQQALLDSGGGDVNSGVVKTNIAAITGSRVQKIAQYNVDAMKADTAGHFRSSDLPFHINPSEKDTKCVNVYSQ